VLQDISSHGFALPPMYPTVPLLVSSAVVLFVSGLPKLNAWGEAVMAHPAVAGSICPPDASQPYMDQLLSNYKEYIAKRKAATAK
jgi:hypothetical protein